MLTSGIPARKEIWFEPTGSSFLLSVFPMNDDLFTVAVHNTTKQKPDLDRLQLEDIIDVPAVQSLLESFHRVTGLAGAIVDCNGKVLVGVGWQDICTQFHRCHPEAQQHCVESDTFLASGAAPGEFKSYLCRNGMHDIASPITIDGHHMGNIYFGQFLYSDEAPDVERFRNQAARYGFEEGSYLNALSRVPSYDRETVKEVMSFYTKLADMISTLGLKTVNLAGALAKQQESEKEIRNQLAQKEVLVKEIHHRIKNNIASIEGFLSLQADSTHSGEAKDTLRQAIARVHSVRSLYETLLIGEDQHEVSVKDYTERIVESLLAISPEAAHITVERQIADFALSAKQVLPVGIVLNELLTNIFKHAFAGRPTGHVAIQLDKTGTQVTLTIKDNGVGLDERAAENPSTGFGLAIVRMLAEQLDGTYSMKTGNGTQSVLEFALQSE